MLARPRTPAQIPQGAASARRGTRTVPDHKTLARYTGCSYALADPLASKFNFSPGTLTQGIKQVKLIANCGPPRRNEAAEGANSGQGGLREDINAHRRV